MASPLTIEQTRFVVKQSALGATAAEIIRKFTDKFGRKINPNTVSAIKRRNAGVLTQTRETIAATDAANAAAIRQKAYTLLDRKLERATEDEGELEKLRIDHRNGLIDDEEYREKVALYERMTINELVKVSDSMNSALKQGKDPEPMSPQDQAALAALVSGIQSGNPFQLVQVLNNANKEENQEA